MCNNCGGNKRICPQYQNHQKGTPFYPMAVYNGTLTAATNRAAPTTDIDHSGREFRRFVNASGAQDMQIFNGLQRFTAFGKRIPWVTYLYVVEPRIPGQRRDNYGGFINKGPGPLEFQQIYQQTAGSQPQAPGGVGQIMGDSLYNPGTS